MQESNLPLPTSGATDSQLVSPQFLETLMRAGDEQIVRRLIEERAELVRAACRWNGYRNPTDRRPRSRDQIGLASAATPAAIRNGADFAAAVRGN